MSAGENDSPPRRSTQPSKVASTPARIPDETASSSAAQASARAASAPAPTTPAPTTAPSARSESRHCGTSIVSARNQPPTRTAHARSANQIPSRDPDSTTRPARTIATMAPSPLKPRAANRRSSGTAMRTPGWTTGTARTTPKRPAALGQPLCGRCPSLSSSSTIVPANQPSCPPV